jgi:ribosomal protein S26
MDSDIKDYCFVSSFNFEALAELEIVSVANLYKVRTIYLTNFYNHIACPSHEQIVRLGDGVNVQYEHITKELVDLLH